MDHDTAPSGAGAGAGATSDFDRHTAVEPAGEGSWSATLDAGWSVGGGLNGGYLLAVVGSALRAASPAKPHAVALSAHFLGPGVPGPATVEVSTRRAGGRFTTLAADLVQDGRPRITALATCADLGSLPASPDDVRTTARPPQLPPVEECVANTAAPAELRAVAPLMERFEMRFHPDHVGWTVGRPSGRGALTAWFRLADRDPDPVSLLMAVDALPPVTFDLGIPGWAPTMELTAHVRALPAPGWLLLHHQTGNLAGGLFEEDCEVWDQAGRLVAQSRQLALLPR